MDAAVANENSLTLTLTLHNVSLLLFFSFSPTLTLLLHSHIISTLRCIGLSHLSGMPHPPCLQHLLMYSNCQSTATEVACVALR